MPAFSSHPLPPPPPPLLPQQEAHAASMQVQAPPAEPELLLRLAAVLHDCNICMWDFPVRSMPRHRAVRVGKGVLRHPNWVRKRREHCQSTSAHSAICMRTLRYLSHAQRAGGSDQPLCAAAVAAAAAAAGAQRPRQRQQHAVAAGDGSSPTIRETTSLLAKFLAKLSSSWGHHPTLAHI